MLKYGIRVVAMFFCTVLTMGVVLAADCNGGTSTKKTDTTCIEQGLRAAVALSDRMYLEVMKKINPKDRALMQKTWGEWAVEHSDICKLTLDTEERIRWVNAARKDINKAACLWLLISRDNNGLESMLGKNSSPQPEFNFDFWSGLYANPTKPVSFTEVLEPASVPLPSAALDPKQVAGVAPAKVAALNLKFFPAFANYERNLQLYESGDSKLTLEQVYTEAVNLEEPWIADIDALYRAGEASGVPLEDQPEYKPYLEFQNKEVAHFSAWNNELMWAEPRILFYQALAQKRGTPADQAFFTARPFDKKSYLEMVTDYSVCTVFGEGQIVNSYSAWHRYAKQYPTAYQKYAKNFLQDAIEELTQGHCVCGGQDDWKKELQLFIKTYPKSKLNPLLKRRLTSLRYVVLAESILPMEFQCRPH